MLNTPAELHVALVDWIVAHGTLMGTFGPRGGGDPLALSVVADREALLSDRIDYDRSRVGDLGGEQWCENTFGEAHPHPGLWADVESHNKHSVGVGRWFVPGEKYTLSEVILDILTATA